MMIRLQILSACVFLNALSLVDAQGLSPVLIAEVPEKSFAAHNEILVVTAEKINPGPHNYGNPPSGQFKVEEALRRSRIRKDRVQLRWVARKHPSHYEQWNDSMPAEWRTRFYLRPLKQAPLLALPLSEKLIVVAQILPRKVQGLPALKVYEAYPYTESNLTTLRKHMGRTDWPSFILLPLWIAVFLLIIPATRSLARSCTRDLPVQNREFRRGSILLATAMGLWVLFECGNVTGGIRVDLLLLFPLFILNTIFFVLLGGVRVFRFCKQ